jgi:GDPmannose 4,6-dehydratase
VQKVQPDKIYDLAAQSHVQMNFERPEYTVNAEALGMPRLLEAMRILGIAEQVQFCAALTACLPHVIVLPGLRAVAINKAG